ncbi:MAG: hypothetical protein OEY49_17875 [Candidatus Heimdallarchaeota archaeon]|nr:hypothetical protein [Candidatus Heimdallarchaeota archaeon]
MYLFDTTAVINWLYSDKLSQIINGKVSLSVLSMVELIPVAKKKGKTTLDALNKFFEEVEIILVSKPMGLLASDIIYQLRREG